ncbi:hypothetical protein ACWEK5_27085 [Rhodococcus koreensis]
MSAVEKHLRNISLKSAGKHTFSSAEGRNGAVTVDFVQVEAENGRDGPAPGALGNSTAGDRDVDRVRTLILIGTALGLGAGLVCTSLFAWWLSYPVHVYTASYEPLGADVTTGRMESVNPLPFLAAGLIISAVLGALSGFLAARRGWRLTQHAT